MLLYQTANYLNINLTNLPKTFPISYDWRGMPVEFTQYPPQENTIGKIDNERVC